MDIDSSAAVIRLIAAVCCTLAPALLLASNIPPIGADGKRRWTLSRADWFLRFSTYLFTWAIAYAYWEATFHGAPVAPRTWIVGIASVYLLIAAVLLLRKRRR